MRTALAMVLMVVSGIAQSQTYPARSVQMLLGFSAGGSVDIMARGVAEEISNLLRQRYVVINREGASGAVAMSAVAAAAADGYTLAIGPATPLTNVLHLQKDLPFKLNSFEYVCQTFRNDFTISVRKESSYTTLVELIDALKRQPGKLSYAHAGTATIPHLAAVELLQKAGVQAIDVPYKGDAALIPALLGGQVDFGVPSVLSVTGQRDRLRVLVVFGERRHPSYPDLPTTAEIGFPVSPNQGLNGIYAPKGTPRNVLRVLEAACEKAVKGEKLAALATSYHSNPHYMSGTDFARLVEQDHREKGELIRALALTR